MRRRIQNVILQSALALAATAVIAAPVDLPKPSPMDRHLVQYEVALRQERGSDAVSVLQRVAAAHHGIVTKLDRDGKRAVITLPANHGAGLQEDPLVTATPSNGTPGRRIDHLKPVTMTTFLWDSGTYSYDGAGNITAIGSDRFEYDGVNRITSGAVQVTTPTSTRTDTQTYTYDPFGNRLTADALNHGCAGSMNCGINVTIDPRTNRITKATIAATDYPVSYDDAGNVTAFAGTNFTYDALGSMVTRSDGQGPQFVYDANDERVGIHDNHNGQWTWTLRDVSGRQLREYTVGTQAGRTKWGTTPWTWTRDHIYRGDQLLASVTPSANGPVMQHMHLDHLGTPRVITRDGVRVGLKTYLPFGAEEASAPVETPEENHKFTGHEYDEMYNGQFATDYMHARYYNATAGRFLSVDPTLDTEKALREPQIWNRYSYVGNNPLKYTDPNGKERLAYWNLGRDAVPDRGFKTEMIETSKTAALFGGMFVGPSLAAEGAFEGSLLLMRNPGAVLAAMKVLDALGGDGSTHVNPTGLTGNKVGYLLGEFATVESRGKGGFFAGVMGFTSKTLGAALRSQFAENFAKNGLLQADGRLAVTGPMTGANGVVATVKTVWQWVEKTKTWDLITAVPPK